MIYQQLGVKLQAGCMFLFVGNKTGSCTCFPFPLRWGRSVEVKQASTSPCLAYQGESEPLQRRGDTRVGRGQALLTDLRRSGKPAPHHWLMFGIGKEKAAEDVLLYARLSIFQWLSPLECFSSTTISTCLVFAHVILVESSRQRWRSSGELETMDPGLECSRDGGREGRPTGSDLCAP
ncbi:uncharacterized protein [Triticum aestivum]|uniref:uncharacterized protein n=1 Tax=Triticum aestivum TaxID=4565 RepID=UPI001D00E462|nr:uncharacterized protein LOC123068494 [Triticum aestivum]